MAMQAVISTDSHGDITLHMNGGLNFENNILLKDALIELMHNHPTSIISLDMNNLNFVGSSGIGHFVETINMLNKKSNQVRLTNISGEFLKVFRLYKLDNLDTPTIIQDTDTEIETETTIDPVIATAEAECPN